MSPLTEQEKKNISALGESTDNGAYDAYGPNPRNDQLVNQPEYINENPSGESYWNDQFTDQYNEFSAMEGYVSPGGDDGPPIQVGDYGPIPESYWGPQQVARYANYIQSQPSDWESPDWMDTNAILSANDELIRANPGQTWENWSNTPVSQQLTSGLRTPPIEAVPEWEKNKTNWSAVDEAMDKKGFKVYDVTSVPDEVKNTYLKDQPATTLGGNKFYLPVDVNPETGIKQTMQPGQYTPQSVGSFVAGMPADKYNQLEPWKQILAPLMAQFPTAMGAVMGGVMGAKLGPVGAVVGAGGMGALSWLQTQVDKDGNPKYPGLIDLFSKLDLPAEGVERGVGFASMVIDSLTDPEKYGPVGEVLNDYKAAWDAAHITYDIAAPFVSEGNKIYSDTLTEPGQKVYTLSDEENSKNISSAFLTEARRRLAAGEDTQSVYADIKGRFGIRGDLQDMVGHIVIDPLNMLPEATSKTIGKVADISGKPVMAKAFTNAEGPISGLREYGQIVRTTLTEAERIKMNPVAKWAAGLDKLSNIRDYNAPGPKQNPFDYLLGLDRKSRATVVLHNSLDGIGQAMNMLDPDDPNYTTQVMKLVDQMSSLTPRDTVDGLSKSTLPKWFDSAEAQHVPGMLKDQGPVIKDLAAQWDAFEGDRTIVNKIAEGLGVEPNKLVAELHNATPETANARYRQFIDDIAVRSATESKLDPSEFQKQLRAAKTPDDIIKIVPPGQAGDLLKAILTDPSVNRLSGKGLKILADKFVGEKAPGIGLDKSMFTARVMMALESGIGKEAATFFGVKPSNAFMRSAALVKKAQGLVLLGQNPANFVNNTLNNYATIGADLGYRALVGSTQAGRDNWKNETGIKSSRMSEGGLYAGETGFDNVPSEIAAAGKAKGKIQAATDTLARASKNPLITPFSSLSRGAEVTARDIAFTTSAREFIDRNWIPGKGFDKITPDLRTVLDTVEPGLAEKIEKAVARGKNVTDIEKQVFGNLDRKSLSDVLSPEEVTEYRKFNTDAFDALQKTIDEGGNVDKARQAYTDTVMRQIGDMHEQDTFNTVQNAMTTVSAEGIKGLADKAGNIFEDYAEFHQHHMDNMADTAIRADNEPDYETRSAIWRESLRQSNTEWAQFWNEHDKKWLGYLRGMGEIDPNEAGSLNILYDMRQNQRAFFDIRQDMYDTHALTKFATKEESAADWQKIQTLLNEEYADMVVEESHLQTKFDGHVRDVFVEKALQGIEDPLRREMLDAEITLWLGRRAEVRRKMAEQELLFRTGAIQPDVLAEFGDLVPPDVKKQIDLYRNQTDKNAGKETYYKKVYQRGIAEMLDTTNRNAPGRTQMTPERVQEAKPYIEQASVEKMRSDLRKVAHDLGGITNDVHLINTVKKYSGVEVLSLNDVTPELLLEALTKRNLESGTPFVAPIEPDPIKLVTDRAQEMVRPTVETPAFKEWFAGSKVIDEKGNPLIVYHGTNENFDFFDLSKAGQQKYSDWGDGIYLTPDKTTADHYRREAVKKLDPEYQSAYKKYEDLTKGTKVINGAPQYSEEARAALSEFQRIANEKYLTKEGLIYEVYANIKNPLIKGYQSTADPTLANYAKSKGFDGIIILNKDKSIDEIVAFSSDQVEIKNKVDLKTAKLLQEMQPGERLPEDAVPLGTVDSLMDMPKADGMRETYLNHIKPSLSKLDALKGQENLPPTSVLQKQLDPKVMDGINAYLEKVKQQRADTNMGAIRYGEGKADFALLNYGRQTNMDNLTNVALPYQFWYSRSIFNWALRAIEKPSINANYYRLMNFTNAQTSDRDGFPLRLKGKIGMHLPFLPDGMQDVYIDPYRQIFPFLNIARPWTDFLTAQNRENKKAQTILQDMVDNGDLTQPEADTAIQTMQGDNWSKALAQARNDLDSDTGNPLDFAQTISGFSLPVSMAVNLASGRTDRIGMLPATRILKNITAAAGYNNYKGVDLSFYGDPYEENRISTTLANMVANREITEDEFNIAMIDREGKAYTLATQKVSYMNMAKSLIPGMGFDFYPEGEQKARAMDTTYKSEVIPAFEKGDTEAKRNFFDANPGLSARYASFKDPEVMTKSYLEFAASGAYFDMPKLYQDQVKEQLGPAFEDWINSKSPRPTMPNSTLAGWAQAMGKIMPKSIDAANTPLRFAQPEIAKKVQDYYDLQAKLFPWAKEAWNEYYTYPENSPQRKAMTDSKQFQQMFAWSDAYKANHADIIPWVTKESDELFGVDTKIAKQVYAYKAELAGKFPKGYESPGYSEWQSKYLSSHPEIIQYVIGENNSLVGLPTKIQLFVYQYRVAKDQKYPGVDATLDEHYNLPKSKQAAHSKQHPEMWEYLDWQKEMAGMYPDAASYIVSDNTIRKGLGQEAIPYNPISPAIMSEGLQGQYQDFIYNKVPLSTGANMEMKRLWETNGKPEGDYQSFLMSLGG